MLMRRTSIVLDLCGGPVDLTNHLLPSLQMLSQDFVHKRIGCGHVEESRRNDRIAKVLYYIAIEFLESTEFQGVSQP